MITLSRQDVNQSFGPLFPEKFLVIVDDRAGIAEIIERCRAHIDQAEREAKTLGIEFLDNYEGKGRIGALGAVSWGNRGIEAAGLYYEHL
jgi:tRNA(Ile2) C34 agmatinyltransferase TiaS